MFNLLTIIVDAIHCRWRGDGMAETGGTGHATQGDCQTTPSRHISHALACRSVAEDHEDQ